MRRAPPPTDCPVARRGLWSALAAIIAGLASSAMAGWLWMQLRQHAGWSVTGALPDGGAMSVLVAAGALLAGMFHRHLASRPILRLRWDGAGWLLLAADGSTVDQAGSAALMLDWGDWMLLRWRGTAGHLGHWLPMSRQVAGAAAWHALRIAVQAPARPAVPMGQAPASGAAERSA